MDRNHQDGTESKRTMVEDVRWKVNRKSKLWVPKHKKRTGLEEKTLWDWLNLLATLLIPLVVVCATIAFGWWQTHLNDVQHGRDQASANLQHERDQASALDQQRATILQTYIDNIQELLLHDNLLKSSSLDPKNPYHDIAILARARTLTALRGLDPERKGLLVEFIYEANLINYDASYQTNNPIIDLTNADLSGADLSGANLDYADLSGANLDGAILTEALLMGADLRGTEYCCSSLLGADYNTKTMQWKDNQGHLLTLGPTQWPKGFDPASAGLICAFGSWWQIEPDGKCSSK